MSNTEAPFVVSHNFCAVRADTPEELLAKLNAFNATPNVQAAISQFRDTVSNQPSRPAEPLQGVMQGVMQATAPVVEAPMQIAPDVAAAVNNIQAAGMTGQIIPAGIEERPGKWNNKPNPELYQKRSRYCSCLCWSLPKKNPQSIHNKSWREEKRLGVRSRLTIWKLARKRRRKLQDRLD